MTIENLQAEPITRNDLQANSPIDFPTCGRAVVVDPDRKDLRTCSDVLRRLGFEVRTFTICQEAMRCLAEAPAEFVFVNQGSEAFEWQEIIRRALLHDRRTPVIVTTRTLNLECYLEAIHLGATDYIEKPLTTAEIERLVTTYSHHRLLQVGRSAA